MQLLIDLHGQIHCLYSEQIDLRSLGELTIHRVSFVEPDHTDWYADLSPVAGPILGPFTLRSQALQAEFDWLEQYLVTLSEKATLNAV